MPPNWLDPLAQPRETVEHDVELQGAVGVVVAADEQVFAHGHVGKNHFAFRHEHGGVADAAPGGLAVRGPAINEDVALPRRQQADDGLEQGGFARAVRAEQADDLAGAHVQTDAVDNLKAAVAASQIFDLQ